MQTSHLFQKSLATVALCSLIAACGGGGGDTPSNTGGGGAGSGGVIIQPAPVSQFKIEDADSVASVASQIVTLRDLSLLPFQGVGTSGLAKKSVGIKSKPVANALKSETVSETCSGGGSISVTADDANNNTQLDSGDTVSVSLNNCTDGTENASGSISVRITGVTGDVDTNVFSVNFTVSANNVVITNRVTGKRDTANGSLTAELRSTSATAQSFAIRAASVTSTQRLTANAPTRTSTVTNAAILGTLTNGNLSESISARITDSALVGGRAIDINTTAPILTNSTDLYPRSGTLTFAVTTAPRSNARLVALNSSQVRLDVDPDGDGVYAPADSRTYQWTQLY